MFNIMLNSNRLFSHNCVFKLTKIIVVASNKKKPTTRQYRLIKCHETTNTINNE